MADGLNKVFLLGNLGSDPEFKVTTAGTGLLKLRLATSASYRDATGTRQETTTWHTVVMFGRRAEGLSKFLAKGMRIFVEGRLSVSSYETRDGQKRTRVEVIAENVLMAGGSARGRGADNGPSTDEDEKEPEKNDDDIPF